MDRFYVDQQVRLDGIPARVHEVTDDEGEPYVGVFLLIARSDLAAEPETPVRYTARRYVQDALRASETTSRHLIGHWHGTVTDEEWFTASDGERVHLGYVFLGSAPHLYLVTEVTQDS